MRWNWQQKDWPNFTWDSARLARAEERFLVGTGVLIGAAKHLGEPDLERLTVEEMSLEALTTSEIEGEFLNRASVQSSIQKQLGLASDERRIAPAEQGISELMVGLYRSVQIPLSVDMLFGWHRMTMSGRKDLRDVGRYRTGVEPMQVVSGPTYARKVHFEALPSNRVPSEMDRFIAWFNRTAPGGAEPLPALTRAGIAHLYFESIHPFEDGNGRIGRAIAEKALVQSFGQTILVALAAAILARHRSYYDALEAANKRNEVTDWLAWFGGIAMEAQLGTTAKVEFLIDKTKLFDRLRGKLNARQTKVLLRMMEEGPEGFKGGLSAGNYSTIAGTSSATATRDLADLVEQGALLRQGERKHARYALHMPPRAVPRILIDKSGEVVMSVSFP
ncbi:MAG TPA: Fic family protein [Acidobacteriaceae bacterium]